MIKIGVTFLWRLIHRTKSFVCGNHCVQNCAKLAPAWGQVTTKLRSAHGWDTSRCWGWDNFTRWADRRDYIFIMLCVRSQPGARGAGWSTATARWCGGWLAGRAACSSAGTGGWPSSHSCPPHTTAPWTCSTPDTHLSFKCVVNIMMTDRLFSMMSHFCCSQTKKATLAHRVRNDCWWG